MEERLLYFLWIWTPESEIPTLWPERVQIKQKLLFRSMTIYRYDGTLLIFSFTDKNKLMCELFFERYKLEKI